jgi:hypothetical protein
MSRVRCRHHARHSRTRQLEFGDAVGTRFAQAPPRRAGLRASARVLLASAESVRGAGSDRADVLGNTDRLPESVIVNCTAVASVLHGAH